MDRAPSPSSGVPSEIPSGAPSASLSHTPSRAPGPVSPGCGAPPADIEARQPLWDDARLDASRQRALADWNGEDDVWLFAYGSLIWNPECSWAESRRARIYGLHRSLCMWSTVNRGTPDCPGLVLALDAGGSCEGLVYRIPSTCVRHEFSRLWKREMPRGSYQPSWVKAHTPQGTVRALAFVMDRRVSTYAGRLEDPTVMQVLQRACGRYGTTVEYVRRTVESLRHHGLRDPRLERLVALFDATPCA